MKIVLILLAIIGALVLIPLIIALFVKKEYDISRQITINRPKEEVFNYIKLLRNQDNYNKWVMTDPAMKKGFRGTDGNVGFVYVWDGKAGKGEQEIKSISEGVNLLMEMRFERPFKGLANAYMYTETVDGAQTKVTWGMKGSSNYPMNFMNLFNDRLLGTDLEASLGNLKRLLEK